MKRCLIALVCIMACASPEMEILNFEFYDHNGIEYSTTKLVDQLEERYNHRYEKIKIILMETPSLADPVFMKQQKYFYRAGRNFADELDLLYVVSCPSPGPFGGHFTSPETYQALSGINTGFRLRIIGKGGEVIGTYKKPQPPDKIKKIIKRYNRRF